MTINITKDISRISAGGIRNLTARQIKYALLTAAVILPVTIGLCFLHVNTTIACIIAAVCGMPIARIGFFNKYGMNYQEYRRAKKECERQEPLYYVSTESPVYQHHVPEPVNNKEDWLNRLMKKLIEKNKKGEDTDASE